MWWKCCSLFGSQLCMHSDIHSHLLLTLYCLSCFSRSYTVVVVSADPLSLSHTHPLSLSLSLSVTVSNWTWFLGTPSGIRSTPSPKCAGVLDCSSGPPLAGLQSRVLRCGGKGGGVFHDFCV